MNRVAALLCFLLATLPAAFGQTENAQRCLERPFFTCHGSDQDGRNRERGDRTRSCSHHSGQWHYSVCKARQRHRIWRRISRRRAAAC